MKYRLLKTACFAVILGCGFVGANAVMADPPAHAKAHGWRKKHVGHTGHEWVRDFGVLQGNCNRKEVGTVVGAVIGGAIGSQVGSGDGRTVAIVVGSVLGAVVGREIGRDLDDGDRACVGHALELAQGGQGVRWLNDHTDVAYLLTPLKAGPYDGKDCRRFTIEAAHGGKSQTSSGRACRDASGTWKMISR